MENKINLSLSVDEVNGVLGALAKGPYEVVEPLITKIRFQAIPQVDGNDSHGEGAEKRMEPKPD